MSLALKTAAEGIEGGQKIRPQKMRMLNPDSKSETGKAFLNEKTVGGGENNVYFFLRLCLNAIVSDS